MQDILTAIEKAGDAANDAWLTDPSGPVVALSSPSSASWARTWPPRAWCGAPARATSASIHPSAKVAVQIGGDADPDAEFTTLVKEIAMQIARQPAVCVPRRRSGGALDRRGIYRAQVEETKKPANIIEKIVGKLRSYYKQVVLRAESVRDSKLSVNDVLAAASKALARR
jgi:translation elongation factor EF-Ts